MSAADESTTIVLPSALVAEVQAAASEEHRSAAEIVQDAVSEYVRLRRWHRVLAYGSEQAGQMGLAEADIPQLIAETRAAARRPG